MSRFQGYTRDYLFAFADRLRHVRISDNDGTRPAYLPFGAPESGSLDVARELRSAPDVGRRRQRLQPFPGLGGYRQRVDERVQRRLRDAEDDLLELPRLRQAPRRGDVVDHLLPAAGGIKIAPAEQRALAPPGEIEELGEGPARRFVLQLPERRVMLGGQLRGTELEANIDGHRSRVTVVAHDAVFSLFDAAGVTEFALQSADFGVELDNAGANAFVAPMNGSVVSVLVEPDQRVAKGDALLIMEAMKMEHSIRAPTAGRVTELFYAAGDLVDGGVEQFRHPTGSRGAYRMLHFHRFHDQ